jgi:iron complex outermembrane receptor protein
MNKAVIFLVLIFFINCPPIFAQRENDRTNLSTIYIESEANDGKAEDGYIMKQPRKIGIWDSKPQLETPYSVNSYSSELISNVQPNEVVDLFKIFPNVMGAESYININTNVYSRGLWPDGVTGRVIINGIQMDNNGMGVFLEDIESVDVYSGLSGFMYGLQKVGGFANYNLKQPTYEFMNKIKIGYNQGQAVGHIDVGGPLVKDKLAFRLNIVDMDGETFVDGQNKTKYYFSGAVDWRILDNLNLTLYGSLGHYKLLGRQTIFTRSGTFLPAVPDPRQLWSSPSSYHDLKTVNYGISANYIPNDVLKFRFAYMHREANRTSLSSASQFIANTNNYSTIYTIMNWDYRSDGYSAYVDLNFDTLSINHNVTMGVNGYIAKRYDGRHCITPVCANTLNTNLINTVVGLTGLYPQIQPNGRFIGSFSDSSIMSNLNLDNVDFYRYYNGSYLTTKNQNFNIVIGDDIKFNDQWNLMVGLNRALFNTKAYDVGTGRLTNSYTSTAITPTVSLIFKPLPTIATYATYIESLEPGSQVGAAFKNAGEQLDPTISKQYEIGVKAELWNMFMTAALFQIERASVINVGAPGAPNSELTVRQDGLARHKGIELAFRGRLFDSLNLIGGFTYVQSKRIRTQNGTLDGYSLTLAPEYLAKLYAEYDLQFIDGLTLTGGIFYTGSAQFDDLNTVQVPSRTLLDLGARYNANLFGIDTTFRLDVANITDKRYWSYNAGEIGFGSPRTFVFTVETSF